MRDVSADYARSILHYDPGTGIFTWKVSRGRRCKSGQTAGTLCTAGYRQIRIDGVAILAHRLAWLFVHGEMPTPAIDHINRAKDDNRIENLRLATCSQNGANRPRNTNNKSGFKGVWWRKDIRRWQAAIRVDGRLIHLGYFDDPIVANAAYLAAAKTNFKQFASA